MSIIALFSFLALSAAAGNPISATEFVVSSPRLPLIAGGGEIESGKDRKGTDSLERRFNLGAPGVWYVWLLVSSEEGTPAVISYSLDDKQPLKSARREIMVPPFAKKQWISYTRYRHSPGFRAQVHVDVSGIHTLQIRLSHGKVMVHKIALTLHFGAKPLGETLDHSDDPGMSRSTFPVGDMAVDGYREDWKSPGIKALRSFYLDEEKGNDLADGKTPATAWRTTARASALEYQPGDALLLKRGGRFRGGLHLRGEGTEGKPITVGAYGEGGRPVIDGMDRDAFRLTHQSWWVVQDLAVTSDPEVKECGISILAGDEKPQPKGIRIYNCVAYDNGGHGIHVGGGGDQDNGYDGVIIENCLSFWNGGDGIQVNGADQNGCRNSVVRFCTAYGNPGMAGIWIHSGQNGLIERCRAYNNACINIWTWNSINVTMRRCEAFRGRPPADAGGFDIDWGCEACTVEYCYSHHNMGVGFLLMGHGILDYRGFTQKSNYNLMRYCISEGDGPGIGLTETFMFGKVHNNISVARGKDRAALDCGGWPLEPWEGGGYSGGWPSDTEFFGNILVGMEGGLPMTVDDFATRQNNTFDHNLFFLAGGPGALIKWAGRRFGAGFWEGTNRGSFPPDTYGNLKRFREATKQEAHGINADPKLNGLGEGGYGRLPLPAYRKRPGSPAAGAGKLVALDEKWLAGRAKFLTDTGAQKWGIPMAPDSVASMDYWEQVITPTDPVSIGAEK